MAFLTCVDVFHVVITEIKGPEAPCTLEISYFEMTDWIMRQINMNNILWNTCGHLS